MVRRNCLCLLLVHRDGLRIKEYSRVQGLLHIEICEIKQLLSAVGVTETQKLQNI
jgi:hypothetical protein